MVSFTSLTAAFGGATGPAVGSVFSRGPCQASAVCKASDRRAGSRRNETRLMRPPQQERLSKTEGRFPDETCVAYAILVSSYYLGQACFCPVVAQFRKPTTEARRRSGHLTIGSSAHRNSLCFQITRSPDPAERDHTILCVSVPQRWISSKCTSTCWPYYWTVMAQARTILGQTIQGLGAYRLRAHQE